MEQGDRLSGCLITGNYTKFVTRREQQVITFCYDNFKNIFPYAVERYFWIEEEGPTDTLLFLMKLDNEDELVSDYEGENINWIEMTAMQRVGGEI